MGVVLPHLNGKLTGMAFRVPTLDVSALACPTGLPSQSLRTLAGPSRVADARALDRMFVPGCAAVGGVQKQASHPLGRAVRSRLAQHFCATGVCGPPDRPPGEARQVFPALLFYPFSIRIYLFSNHRCLWST